VLSAISKICSLVFLAILVVMFERLAVNAYLSADEEHLEILLLISGSPAGFWSQLGGYR
jgi:hypothetical protein